MLINNIDTTKYNAALLDYHIENSEIVTLEEWENNWLVPFRTGQFFKYVNINCEFEIDMMTENEAQKNISKLIKQASQATLKFDDLDFFYDGYLESHTKEKIIRGKYIVNLNFKCSLGYEEAVTKNIANTSSITLNSTATTPVIIEIIPTENREIVNIKGFGEDIAIKNLTAGKKVIIDGEKGLITENGQNKWLDYDSWGFPKLEPGSNEIETDIPITIRYKPRWI